MLCLRTWIENDQDLEKQVQIKFSFDESKKCNLTHDDVEDRNESQANISEVNRQRLNLKQNLRKYNTENKTSGKIVKIKLYN